MRYKAWRSNKDKSLQQRDEPEDFDPRHCLSAHLIGNQRRREAKRLYRANPKTGERRSLREISKELAKLGFRNEFGEPYHPRSIQRMIQGDRPV